MRDPLRGVAQRRALHQLAVRDLGAQVWQCKEQTQAARGQNAKKIEEARIFATAKSTQQTDSVGLLDQSLGSIQS
jgi:hypothetical protein